MSNTVLVIAAHPDDELLGAGGTVRRHALDGDTVHLVVVCEGVTMRYQGQDVPQQEHGAKAAEILGAASIKMLGFPDQHLDTLCLVDIAKPLEELVRSLKPQIVYTHFGEDLNMDHRMVFEAVSVACRPAVAQVEAVYGFETPSSTEWHLPIRFSPNYFVDISETLEEKLTAFECYESEVRDYPHPRSIESLRHRAHYWGNLVNMNAAEGFVCYRRLWR